MKSEIEREREKELPNKTKHIYEYIERVSSTTQTDLQLQRVVGDKWPYNRQTDRQNKRESKREIARKSPFTPPV